MALPAELTRIRADLDTQHAEWLREMSRLQVATAQSITLVFMLLVTAGLMLAESLLR